MCRQPSPSLPTSSNDRAGPIASEMRYGNGTTHADARLEGCHLPVTRPAALGEEDVHRLVVDQPPPQFLQPAHAHLAPPHRQRVEEVRRERRLAALLEEHVAGRQGEQAVAEAQRHSAADHKGVEVAGVVGDQHRRPARGQVLAPGDAQAVEHAEEQPQPAPPPQTQDARYEPVLAPRVAVALQPRLLQVARRLQVPGLHGCPLSCRRNRRLACSVASRNRRAACSYDQRLSSRCPGPPSGPRYSDR